MGTREGSGYWNFPLMVEEMKTEIAPTVEIITKHGLQFSGISVDIEKLLDAQGSYKEPHFIQIRISQLSRGLYHKN
jgi:hypothetical protein